jgi:hypothetical protein
MRLEDFPQPSDHFLSFLQNLRPRQSPFPGEWADQGLLVIGSKEVIDDIAMKRRKVGGGDEMIDQFGCEGVHENKKKAQQNRCPLDLQVYDLLQEPAPESVGIPVTGSSHGLAGCQVDQSVGGLTNSDKDIKSGMSRQKTLALY